MLMLLIVDEGDSEGGLRHFAEEYQVIFARQFANTWDEDGLRSRSEEINPVYLQRASSRLEAIPIGAPPLALAEFEEIRHRLEPPLAERHYGLDLVNDLWHIKNLPSVAT
jgi:hypothetical protein